MMEYDPDPMGVLTERKRRNNKTRKLDQTDLLLTLQHYADADW